MTEGVELRAQVAGCGTDVEFTPQGPELSFDLYPLPPSKFGAHLARASALFLSHGLSQKLLKEP